MNNLFGEIKITVDSFLILRFAKNFLIILFTFSKGLVNMTFDGETDN